MAKKPLEPTPYAKPDQLPTRPNPIFSRLRQKWLVQTPEELVRQTSLNVILNEYGFALDQIAEEEEITGRRGTGHARADFVIWRTVQDRKDQRPPLIIVECKSDNVTIKPADYAQGDNYARITNAPFFVTHNTRETRFWRVRKDRMPGYIEEIRSLRTRKRPASMPRRRRRRPTPMPCMPERSPPRRRACRLRLTRPRKPGKWHGRLARVPRVAGKMPVPP